MRDARVVRSARDRRSSPRVRTERPLLVTVDDLPIAEEVSHSDSLERRQLTSSLLDTLARHGVSALGFVIWGNVKTDADVAILRRWLAAGHELGNHSFAHLPCTGTAARAFIADVERGRRGLTRLLGDHARPLRFFRFPYLREGETYAKVRAIRAYLARTSQRAVPVTMDFGDYRFERPWVEAEAAGDTAELEKLGEQYQRASRREARYVNQLADELFGETVPQILLLHASKVGGAQWDRLFASLREHGFRFARADEVLAHTAISAEPELPIREGSWLWPRLNRERTRSRATPRPAGVVPGASASRPAFAVDTEHPTWVPGDQESHEQKQKLNVTTTTKVTITVRRAEYRDEGAIARFIRSAHGDLAGYHYPERWRWQYRDGPFCSRKQPAVWIAKAGTRVVGQVCAMPVPLQCGQRVVKAFWGCDFLVDEAARGRGIGAVLQREIIAETERFMLLWMNPASHHLADREGMQLAAEVVVMESTNPRKSVAHITKDSGCFDLVSRLGPEADAIWARVTAAETTYGVARSARYLNWKFFAQPNASYIGVVARSRRGGPRGLAILRRGRPPEANIGLIAELISDDETTRRRLLRFATRYFAEQQVSRIQYASSRPEIIACCLAEGYRKRWRMPFLCSPRLLRDCRAPGSWYLSRGDSDWDQYPFGLPRAS